MNQHPEPETATPSLRERLINHLVQNVPDELARCEFNCTPGQCSREEWQHCARRRIVPAILPDEK